MSQHTQSPLTFANISGKKVQADFDAGTLSSDGGVLWLRPLEAQMELIKRLSQVLVDYHHPSYVRHSYEDLLLLDSQTIETVATVTEMALIKTQITREKRGATPLEQEGSDLLVRDALLSEIIANLSDANTPTSQQLTLTGNDVLVKDIHAEVASTMNSSACLSSACVAN